LLKKPGSLLGLMSMHLSGISNELLLFKPIDLKGQWLNLNQIVKPTARGSHKRLTYTDFTSDMTGVGIVIHDIYIAPYTARELL